MIVMKKYIKDLQPGDKLFYLPGRAVAEPDDVVTEQTVLKVETDEDSGYIFRYVYLENFLNGEHPAFTCIDSSTDEPYESFYDKYGWYSTYKDGIKELWNKTIEQEIQFHKDSIERLTKEHLEQIEELKKQFMS